MRTALVVAALVIAGLPTSSAAAEENKGRPSLYPFDVTVGGQLAAAPGTEGTSARIAAPVAADAPIKVGVEAGGLIVINVFPAKESGEVDNARPGSLLTIQEGTTTTLDQTTNKLPLPPGTYLMNVVAAGKTSRVLFTVAGSATAPPKQ